MKPEDIELDVFLAYGMDEPAKPTPDTIDNMENPVIIIDAEGYTVAITDHDLAPWLINLITENLKYPE
jgi:hypothetical protein